MYKAKEQTNNTLPTPVPVPTKKTLSPVADDP